MASHTHSHTHDHAHTYDQSHDAAGMACCSHHNIKLERYMLLYLIGGVLVLATVIVKFFLPTLVSPTIAEIPAVAGALLLGFPLFASSFKELREGHASTSTLCALAILGALAIGQYTTAGFLAFILLVADQFVRQRAWGAQRAIEDLVARTPDMARIVRNGQEAEVSLGEVKVGDTIRVRAGENLPVDGVILTGRTTMDQAALTGESMPQEVQPGDPVYAGTTNLSALVDIKATQVGQDTTIGKVSQLIREAESSRTQKQMMVEQVARFFVPISLCVAFVVWFFNRDQGTTIAVERAITTLVVACPSALLLASPLSIVASFAAAARLGILIKKVNYLEEAASIDTVVMDKTGTMTTGRFIVARLAPAEGVDGADLLEAAANGEQHSNHPLAKSIVSTAQQARISVDGSNDYEEIHGRGIRARTSKGEVLVGRASWILEVKPEVKEALDAATARIEGMSGVHVVRDGRYLGVVGLEDKVRSNTKGVVSKLRELGIRRIDILTGDRLSVAERVGRTVGVDHIEAECLPEEKHEQIQSLTRDGRRVMMIGDGINDGPSLASADIGVAMGMGGTDIAANSAGIALMNDDLSRIPFLIELSRRTRVIIGQNIAAAIVISVLGLILAATGGLGLIGAALYHVVGDIFVIANSFRLFRFGESFANSDLAEKDAEPVKRARRAGSLTLSGGATPVPTAQTA